MVDLGPLIRRNTQFEFQLRLAHYHSDLLEHHKRNPQIEGLVSYKIAPKFNQNIPHWFSELFPVIGRYLGVKLKRSTYLSPDRLIPIGTVTIIAVNEADANIAYKYITYIYTFINLEQNFKRRRYMEEKRKERRRIKKYGLVGERKHEAHASQILVDTRESVITAVYRYMSETLIKGTEDIFPEAFRIRKEKLRILRNEKIKNTGLWKKL